MSGYRDFILTQMLEQFFRGELDDVTANVIYEAACEIALSEAVIYLVEITYHIGYAKSILGDKISETTYKKMKKLAKDNLIKRLSEREII